MRYVCNNKKPKQSNFESSIFSIVVHSLKKTNKHLIYEYAITKRSDIYAKTAKLWKSVLPQNARVKKDVKSMVAAKKWLW